LRKIAEQKMADLNTTDIEKAIKIIEAQAKGMGLDITQGDVAPDRANGRDLRALK